MIYQKELTEQPMPPRNRYRFDNMKPGDHMRFDDPRVAESKAAVALSKRVAAVRMNISKFRSGTTSSQPKEIFYRLQMHYEK